MEQRTYLVIQNYHGSARKEPYSCFVFDSLADAAACSEVDEHAVVFSTAQQLADMLSVSELEGMYMVLSPESGHRRGGFYSALEAAKALTHAVQRCATNYRKQKTMTNEDTDLAAELAAELEHPISKNAKKPKRAKKEPLEKPKKEKKPKKDNGRNPIGKLAYDVTMTITPTGKANPFREGTFRFRNIEAVIGSATVGEALAALRGFEVSPSNAADIKLAVEHGLITLSGGAAEAA